MFTSFQVDTDLLTVHIIDTAIQKAGGRVLPLDALTQHGSYHYSHFSLLLDDTKVEKEVVTHRDSRNSACPGFLPCGTVLSFLHQGNIKQQTSTVHSISEVVEICVGKSLKYILTLYTFDDKL